MKKIELVYRDILQTALSNKKSKFVVREIAKELGISPNTVSFAIMPLKRSGAVKMYLRHFDIINFDKLLAFWAVNRNMDKDIIYRTYVPVKNAEQIEKKMPNEIAYTCCSGYKNLFGNDVSDYSGVYVYAAEDSLMEIKKRFPERKLSERANDYNLFVLKPDKILEEKINSHKLEHDTVSIPQLYVDLWNTTEWYSYEFLKRLKKRINDTYGKAILE
ncbi:MAG: hypothetical protein ABR981_04675 [Candidatus Micrarchaeaceae archaeon]|jgi:DNA-binding transcriptional regulator YhcF (GntR family)